jgi:hypothetical protein
MEQNMQHDVRLRAAARAIFDACFSAEAPVGFDEAERLGSAPYRHAVDVAIQVRSLFNGVKSTQLELI